MSTAGPPGRPGKCIAISKPTAASAATDAGAELGDDLERLRHALAARLVRRPAQLDRAQLDEHLGALDRPSVRPSTTSRWATASS